MASPGLRSELMAMSSNITSLGEAIRNFSTILGGLVMRSQEEASDMAGMSRELTSLSNNTVVSMMDEKREGKNCKELYYTAAKQISSLNTRLVERNSRLDTEVHQKVLSLLDVLTAYTDMMDRHQKGLLKEHKIASEKIGMIKMRDLRGALATDMEMRNLVETNITENEIVLTDLESRQVT